MDGLGGTVGHIVGKRRKKKVATCLGKMAATRVAEARSVERTSVIP
jgi:uncharacterized protein YcfJ